jgi:hypothetical protein
MLADREAIEERDLEVQREEELQTVFNPITKPNDDGEAMLFGAIGILVLMMGASVRR